VSGTLALTDDKINTGTINAEGDVTLGSGFSGGSATVTLTGAGAQSLTSSGGQMPATFNINKPSGTATVLGDTTFITINLQSGTLTFSGGSTYTIKTTGDDITTSSGTTLNFQGSDGNLVTLRKSGGGSWTLNVNADADYTADYVDVKHSDASPGRYIYATNSTDSGNNIDWYFIDKIVFTTVEQEIYVNEASDVMTIQLQNNDGTPVNVPEDITINLSTTSGGGEFSLDDDPFISISSVTIPSGANSANFYYRDSNVGTPEITCEEDPSYGWENALQTETVKSKASYFTVEASSPQIADVAFTLTITAKDSSGETVTDYSGTANLTVNYILPDSGTYDISPSSTSDFNDGVAVVSATYGDCGTITITATDASDPNVTGTSPNIIFYPYDFLVVPSGMDATTGTSARHVVNKPFTLTVTCRNASEETCPNYQGTVELSVNYILPSANQSGSLSTNSLTSNYWTNGIAVVTDMSYDKWGTITIAAADTTLTTQTGTSSNITFIPKDLLITLSDPPPSRTYYYTNEDFSATVTARDCNNNAISNYQGTVSFTGEGLILPEDYTFTTTDEGIHEFTEINGPEEAQTTLSVQDTTYTDITGASDTITLKEGTIKIYSASGPIGSIIVQVKILDSNEDVITEDDSTTFTVAITEFMKDNNSCTSTATSTPVTVTNGFAAIIIRDTEAETVTVTPLSTPVLFAVSGTVRFGTVSGSGVGVQLWREIRKPKEYEEEE